MRIKNLTLSMALAAILFASCEKGERMEVPKIDETKKLELRLNSGVAEQRTSGYFGMDAQISKGEEVSVYVDNSSVQIYGNNVLTADGKGSLTGGKTMYFSADNSRLDIYAFNTNGTLDRNFPSASITHTVNVNQSIDVNYATSDLLYAANKNVAKTKNAVGLTFYHMLSKVEVALGVGSDDIDLSGAEVYIVGTKTKADFTPNKAANASMQTERAAMISVTPTDNDVADIKIGNNVTSNDDWGKKYIYNEAVIVPQKVHEGANFIKVKLSNGKELFYQLPADTNFESGKKYSYQVTVKQYGKLEQMDVVTGGVKEWESVNAVNCDAEIE